MKEKSLAFILRDAESDLDALVYVSMTDDTLDIGVSQVVDNLKDVIIPYVMLTYLEDTDHDSAQELMVHYKDGCFDIHKMYEDFKETGVGIDGVVRDLQDVLDEVSSYYDVRLHDTPKAIRADHSLSVYFVPDFKNMTLEKTNEWLKYFTE